MKVNLNLEIWLLAAMMMVGLTAMAQGRYHRDPRPFANGYDEHFDNNRFAYARYDQRRYSTARVIRHCPPTPYHQVPRRPTPRHVWIAGEYRWRSGGYLFVPGYWMIPPRRNAHYVPGYWEPARGGYIWISGFWQGVGLNISWRN